MREPVKDPARLEHILLAIDRIFSFVDGRDLEDIQKDSMLYYAVVKNIEIIGEAAYMLTPEFKEAHPETPWKIIIGMRHFLVHGYFEVSADEVQNVVEKDLLPLKEQVENYLKEF
jgi:uncharacterized protein with HEPN domain